jgi:YebC/PmpR family DNA-binding regulatory protein
MAGHSKFKNIMHRKGAQDKRRAQLFSKLGREITVAAKTGGGDPNMNPRLRLAMATARGHSMPKDNIEKAIQKGIGGGEGDNFSEMRYEGYGPGGVAFIVDALTDNKNRTAGEIRSIFSKHEGNLGESGSVGFMFERVGEILYPAGATGAEDMFEAAVEAGANNVESDDDGHHVTCTPDDFASVREALTARFGEPEKSGLTWKPTITAKASEEQALLVMKLIDALEENDDVQNVTTNFEVSDDVMTRLLAAG